MNKNGLLIINKPSGMSSFGVVARVRKLLNIKKVGHCGTLDPEATGVLVVAVNKATKIIEYLVNDAKTYKLEMKLGFTSDTYDIWGDVKTNNLIDLTKLNDQKIIDTIKAFVGDYQQMPPIYSAIKVNGKRLYKYAREGLEVEIKARPVTIKKIININKVDDNTWEFTCAVSKGTYIRSLIHDIGSQLKCGAVMSKLTRIESGAFEINDTTELEAINWESLISIEKAWTKEIINIDDLEKIKKLKNGLTIKLKLKDEIALALVDRKPFAILKKINNEVKVHKGMWA